MQGAKACCCVSTLLLGGRLGFGLGGEGLADLAGGPSLGHASCLSLASRLALSSQTSVGQALHDGQFSCCSSSGGHDSFNVLVDLGRKSL